MSDIKDKINEKRNSHLLLLNNLINKGINEEDLIYVYKIYQKYETGMKDRNIHIFDFFKNNEFSENFDSFRDIVILSYNDIRENKIKKFCKSPHIYLDDQDLNLIIKNIAISDISLDEVQLSITKKIKNISTTKELTEELNKLLEYNKNENFNEKYISEKIKKYGLKSIKINNKILVEIKDYESAKIMGFVSWCISRKSDYFKNETSSTFSRFFFEYDFNEKFSNPLSVKAIKVNPSGIITSIHDRYNNLTEKKSEFNFQKMEKERLKKLIDTEFDSINPSIIEEKLINYCINGLFEYINKRKDYPKILENCLYKLNSIDELGLIKEFGDELKKYNIGESIREDSIIYGIKDIIKNEKIKSLINISSIEPFSTYIKKINNENNYLNYKINTLFEKEINNRDFIKEVISNKNDLALELLAKNIFFLIDNNTVTNEKNKEIIDTLSKSNIFYKVSYCDQNLLEKIIIVQKKLNYSEEEIYNYFQNHKEYYINSSELGNKIVKKINLALKNSLLNFEDLEKKYLFKDKELNIFLNNLNSIMLINDKIKFIKERLELMNINELSPIIEKEVKKIIEEYKKIDKDDLIIDFLEKKYNLKENKRIRKCLK